MYIDSVAIKKMDVDEFIEFVKKNQARSGLPAYQFAAQIGVTPKHLSEIYNGKSTPGDVVAAAFSGTRKVVYEVPNPPAAPAKRKEKK